MKTNVVGDVEALEVALLGGDLGEQHVELDRGQGAVLQLRRL